MLSAETLCYQRRHCVTSRVTVLSAETLCFQWGHCVISRESVLSAETLCYIIEQVPLSSLISIGSTQDNVSWLN